MFPILNVGPLAIQTPGLFLIVGLYTSFLIIEKRSIKFSLDGNTVSNLVFMYLISSIVVGRIAYVVQYPSIFLNNPLSIFSISPSLFDFPSGLILSLLFVIIYIQKKKIPVLNLLDGLSFPLLVFLIFLFLSLFASGTLYGKPSTLPWSIFLWGTDRHPLPMYYLLGIIPIVLMNIYKSTFEIIPGKLFFETYFLFSVLVVFLDFFNGNPSNIIYGLNMIQIIAILLMIFFFWVIHKSQKNKKTA